MAQLPSIYIIQSSDAPQHASKLQQILQTLKTENRIDNFSTLSADADLASFTDTIEDDDLVLLTLTHKLEAHKRQIENRLKPLKAKVAEIIVDNVVYDNEFLTFPADLRPIRDRDDMDAVWGDIEQNLKNMFPARQKDLPEGNLPGWLRGVYEWPWKSPGRWHGALFLGLPGAVLALITFYIFLSVDFERDLEFVILSVFFAGLSYAIAGAISRMRKAPLFFAVAMALGIMVLFIIFWGPIYDDTIAFAVAFLGPVSAIVGAVVGRSHTPFRLAGMVLLGLWPFLFSDEGVSEGPFLMNLVIIAVVLCLLAQKKPIEPSRAMKIGILPFALNLVGALMIYLSSSRYAKEDVVLFIVFTAVAATSLGAVNWISRRQISDTN